MAPVVRQRLIVPTADGDLGLIRWGDDLSRPAAVLVHGTGFSASVWDRVATQLADDFVVYGLDRRGHGASKKPADAYDFADFACDVVQVIDALALAEAYAIGHSAGATDLLIAAPRRPHAFRRIVAIEPTAADPERPDRRDELVAGHRDTLRRLPGRRTTFTSRGEALAHYHERGGFAGWHPDLLEAYVTDGFDRLPDGSISLRCTPAIEAAMLTRIFAAMEGTYHGERADHTFSALGRIDVPTVVVTTELSQPIYGQMACVAHRLIPGSSTHHLDGVGHAVAQVAPDRIAALAADFWQADPPHGAARAGA